MFLNRATFRLLAAIRKDARSYVSLHPTRDYPRGLAQAVPAARRTRDRAIANLEALGLVVRHRGRVAWKLTEKGEQVYQLNKDRVGRRVRDE